MERNICSKLIRFFQRIFFLVLPVTVCQLEALYGYGMSSAMLPGTKAMSFYFHKMSDLKVTLLQNFQSTWAMTTNCDSKRSDAKHFNLHFGRHLSHLAICAWSISCQHAKPDYFIRNLVCDSQWWNSRCQSPNTSVQRSRQNCTIFLKSERKLAISEEVVKGEDLCPCVTFELHANNVCFQKFELQNCVYVTDWNLSMPYLLFRDFKCYSEERRKKPE